MATHDITTDSDTLEALARILGAIQTLSHEGQGAEGNRSRMLSLAVDALARQGLDLIDNDPSMVGLHTASDELRALN
ncbi:hypothetical protein [Methylotetracoccus oryzae]|uniref:hypothetical protein n=1 Tax=Methylotetracoccus oryzae TaxID=1919059 RepID=UPI0011185299|nr:hypothetical protein [Methylotetracoccus oryzae]